jgi:hypothetical protein
VVCGGKKGDVISVCLPEKHPALDVPSLKKNMSMGTRATCLLHCCGASKLVPFWPPGGLLDQGGQGSVKKIIILPSKIVGKGG